MTPLNDEFTKFRQAAYKLNHKRSNKRNEPTKPDHEYPDTLKTDAKESSVSEFCIDQYQI